MSNAPVQIAPPRTTDSSHANSFTGSLRKLYPFVSRFLEIDGRRLHYVDEGVGPPIVFLHGNPTWSFYYRELIRGLRDHHRVIVPDHMGCGLSDKPWDYPYTLSTHVANLERLMDALDLRDVTLSVHDWGGAIGMGWAVRHVERVRRLVVFNTAAFLGGRMPFRIRVCRWPILGEVAVLGMNAFVLAATRMACVRRRMTPDVKRGYLRPYDSYAHRVAVLRFVRDIPTNSRVPSFGVLQEIEQRLPRLAHLPTIIFWGMKDFCFTPLYLNEWRRRFPKATVHTFDDAGHYVVEDATDRILPLLSTFLNDAIGG